MLGLVARGRREAQLERQAALPRQLGLGAELQGEIPDQLDAETFGDLRRVEADPVVAQGETDRVFGLAQT